MFTSSSEKGTGREEIIDYIENILKNFNKDIKLQAEIAQLEAMEDKTAIHTEATDTLCSKHYAEADEIAKELLSDLYDTMNYNRLSKSASKVASKSK